MVLVEFSELVNHPQTPRLSVRAILTDALGALAGAHHAGLLRHDFKTAHIYSRPPAGYLVHLKSDQVVSVAAVVSLADPDCFAAGALVDLIDQPADPREGCTGLGNIHDEHGLQRIRR